MRTRVYIAGPYTHPESGANTHEALRAATHLLQLGYAPYVPHLCHLWQTVFPQPDKTWYALDLEYLTVCHALLRLKGESKGADAEVVYAHKLHIPVFYSGFHLTSSIPPKSRAKSTK